MIRVGMIGAGAIAHSHCKGINDHKEAKVVAVADLSNERAEEIKTAYAMEKTFRKWEDLVADDSIDAVAIALPNSLHAPVAAAALQAGKHVILDKPFALNYAEAAQVVKIAKKAKKVFTLGMNQRFNQGHQVIKALAERGEFGEIFHAKAAWMRRTGSPKFGTWFCRKDLAGGGCMLDIGVHVLDMCLYITNNFEPVSVTGKVNTKFGNRGIGEGGWGKSDRGKLVFDVDDSAFAFIRFKNDMVLELNVSWILHQDVGDKNGVQLYGTEAGGTTNPCRVFRFGKQDKEYEVVEPQNVKIRYPHCNRHVNWIDAILGKDELMTPPEQSLVVQKIIDAVYKSSATGKEVRL